MEKDEDWVLLGESDSDADTMRFVDGSGSETDNGSEMSFTMVQIGGRCAAADIDDAAAETPIGGENEEEEEETEDDDDYFDLNLQALAGGETSLKDDPDDCFDLDLVAGLLGIGSPEAESVRAHCAKIDTESEDDEHPEELPRANSYDDIDTETTCSDASTGSDDDYEYDTDEHPDHDEFVRAGLDDIDTESFYTQSSDAAGSDYNYDDDTVGSADAVGSEDEGDADEQQPDDHEMLRAGCADDGIGTGQRLVTTPGFYDAAAAQSFSCSRPRGGLAMGYRDLSRQLQMLAFESSLAMAPDPALNSGECHDTGSSASTESDGTESSDAERTGRHRVTLAEISGDVVAQSGCWSYNDRLAMGHNDVLSRQLQMLAFESSIAMPPRGLVSCDDTETSASTESSDGDTESSDEEDTESSDVSESDEEDTESSDMSKSDEQDTESSDAAMERRALIRWRAMTTSRRHGMLWSREGAHNNDGSENFGAEGRNDHDDEDTENSDTESDEEDTESSSVAESDQEDTESSDAAMERSALMRWRAMTTSRHHGMLWCREGAHNNDEFGKFCTEGSSNHDEDIENSDTKSDEEDTESSDAAMERRALMRWRAMTTSRHHGMLWRCEGAHNNDESEKFCAEGSSNHDDDDIENSDTKRATMRTKRAPTP
ncbi:dentin sialophosphoprotein [Brachypodium distachyon]|uniref:dentin sialophosphoprotein n=1 Tax=Brachypodium distachyon TaxID=15368 RepID=UPI00052FF123|nr:dentin sialophosphoprotein [Brachypodium distachyon]|eukprot:XP_010229474.1 dentin sialophosphoprotein [Brachypodium distachyon]